MAFKQTGSLDFSEGGTGWFICYCPHCRKKVIYKREEYQELRKKLVKPLDNFIKLNIKILIKKVLTSIAESL